MCLAMPGKLVEILTNSGLKMGKIDFDGAITLACLEYVPEIEVGQYTLVHAGFAISILNETEALNSLETWDELRRVMVENQ
jgi:hydrogenase expression/formation protein HypC